MNKYTNTQIHKYTNTQIQNVGIPFLSDHHFMKNNFRSFSLFPIQNWSTGSQDKPWIYHKYRNTQIHKYTNTNTIFCFQSASIVILIHIPNIFHHFEPRLTNFGKWLPLQSLLTSILNFVLRKHCRCSCHDIMI